MVVPVDTPQAKPEELIVATDVVPLLHVPPGIGSVKVVHSPMHTAVPPLIGPMGFTVTVLVTEQVPIAYVIIVEPPVGPDGVTTPVEEIVATAGLPLVHTPPVGVLDKASVVLAHTVDEPAIAVGAGATVTLMFAAQPVPSVYVMPVMPAATPHTRPEVGLAVAIAVLLLLQVPPGVMSVMVVQVPTHSWLAPIILAGMGLKVTAFVTEQVPIA
jgi:hypothetical protein